MASREGQFSDGQGVSRRLLRAAAASGAGLRADLDSGGFAPLEALTLLVDFHRHVPAERIVHQIPHRPARSARPWR